MSDAKPAPIASDAARLGLLPLPQRLRNYAAVYSDHPALACVLTDAAAALSAPPVHAGEVVAWINPSHLDRLTDAGDPFDGCMVWAEPPTADFQPLYEHPASGEDVEGLREAVDRVQRQLDGKLLRTMNGMAPDLELILAALSNRRKS